MLQAMTINLQCVRENKFDSIQSCKNKLLVITKRIFGNEYCCSKELKEEDCLFLSLANLDEGCSHPVSLPCFILISNILYN